MSLVPEELFKRRRRHNNTPQSVLLIFTNFIVVSVNLALFTNKQHVNWFFWVVTGLLALYNFFAVRKNREEYDKATVIAYVISTIVLTGLFFLFKGKA